MIKIQNVHFAFKTREVLKEVSLEIPKGEIFSLLGPNGSGKSTLFRLIATAVPIQKGEILIDGMNLSGVGAIHELPLREIRKKIGVIFQTPSLDLKLTVRENLVHQGHLYGLSGKELFSRINRLMEALSIIDRKAEIAGKLSGGLKRRVEIAKGLLHEPKILLMDEPSTGLDPVSRQDLWVYLRRLREERSLTIFLTTHFMDEAEIASHIAIINEGKILRDGSPESLKKEMSGDVIWLGSKDRESLSQKIQSKFSVKVHAIDGMLQIEHPQGAQFASSLMEAFGREIESITIRRPTLEDVFMYHAGRRFWKEPE